MRLFLLLIVTVAALGVASAATHVNITIAQNAVTNPADVTYIDGEAPAELKAGPTKKADAERSSRLQNAATTSAAEPKKTYATTQQFEQLKQAMEQSRRNQEFERYIQNYHSSPTVETVYEAASPAEPKHQRLVHGGSNSNGHSQRYVAIGGGRSARLQQFERQVALPNSAAESSGPTVSNSVNAGATMESERQQAAAVSGDSAVAAPSATSANVNANGVYDSNSNRAARVGLEQPVNFEAAIAAAKAGYGSVPSHEQEPTLTAYNANSNNNNNYDSQPQVNLHSHIPPAPVQETSSSGFGDYSGYGGRNDDQFRLYGGGGGGGGYLPPSPHQVPEYQAPSDYQPHEYQPSEYQPSEYQPSEYQPTEYQPRPVITKTIQIAQPALKAKKFEVRHPAIQKEFYDIEERVVIKPAGTIVVELEHPVAKIPRGETILPLGHPHPAVAGAYNLQQQGAYGAPTRSPYGAANAAAYAPKAEPTIVGSSTIASNLMTSPGVAAAQDQKTRNDYIEQNLARQYNSPVEAPQNQKSLAPAPVAPASGGDSNEYLVVTDSLGNQRRISKKLFSPIVLGKDEPDRPAPVQRQPQMQLEARRGNNLQPQQSQPQQQHAYAYTNNNNNNNNNNQLRYQTTYNNNNQQQQQIQPSQQYKSDYFAAETLADKDGDTSAAAGDESAKSARLELQPRQQTDSQLRLRQHEFDLASMVKRLKQQQPQPQPLHTRPEIAHTAHVAEIPREFFQRQRSGGGGSITAYATPSAANSRSVRPNFSHYVQEAAADRQTPSVEYSPPYSNMRYVPQDTAARYVRPDGDFDQIDRFQEIPAKLTAQPGPAHTHIQIQLPESSAGANNSPQRIMVSSTIAPPAASARQQAANSELAPDCEPQSERLIAQSTRGQQKFMRLVEAKPAEPTVSINEKATTAAVSGASPAAVVAATAATPTTNAAVENVDVSSKGVSGHVSPIGSAGQRVIAATPAPSAAAGSESFHKRRIVVNHPFQTVREVVEHEPYTNYHEIQVNEPSYGPNAPYIQQLTRTHGALQQFDPSDYEFAYRQHY